MKNIFKSILFAFILVTATSCEKEEGATVSAKGFELRTTTLVTPVVLAPQNDADPVAVLVWDKSDNGAASVPTYIVEVADHNLDPTFANAKQANIGNNIVVTNDLRSYTLTVKELNTLINSLPGYQCGSPMTVDIRIKSTLGAGHYNSFVQYSSNVITVNATPYSGVLPLMSFAMTASGAATADKMAASSVLTTDYEGYMYLLPGNYFFYKGDACNGFATPTEYGDDGNGTFDTLALGGTPYTINTAGVYRVKVDLTTLNYAVTPITAFGIIGAAKVIGSATSNPAFIYDVANKVYRSPAAGINLKGGFTFRFRANNTEVIVLAGFDPTKIGVQYGGPDMSYNGPEIRVPGTTNKFYDLTLDLSSPRHYKYTLTPH